MSDLQQMLEMQRKLQVLAYGKDPGEITDPAEKIQFARDMREALEAELQEAIDEIGWKPWATSKHFNTEAFKWEIVDALFFWLNLALVADMDGFETMEKYESKWKKNYKRQLDGYDGVVGKCGVCKRALDDDAVTCIEDPNHPGYYICSGV